MRSFSISPVEMLRSFWRHRALIAALTKREVLGRYRGSALGILWSLFNPILMLLIYTFVFSVVLKARWRASSDSNTEFALVCFAGLIVFNLYGECVNRAPSLILSNVNYVKKVVFPLEIFPWVSLGSAAFHAVVSLIVWLIFYVVIYGHPQPTAVLLPLVLLPLLLLVLGISWCLASLGVFLRDVGQLIGMITLMLMFLSPIFYPISTVPAPFKTLLLANPLTTIIEQARAVLFWGGLPDWPSYFLLLLASACTAWVGFAWFQKTRKGFADVI